MHFGPQCYVYVQNMHFPNLVCFRFRYIQSLQTLCRQVIRIGSMKDGGKEICVDEAYKPKAPCLVYSFG